MAKKQVIRLTEGDLHKIIKESMNNILKEYVKLNDEYYKKLHEKELKKAKTIIPILLKIINEKHITIPVKSEKISKTRTTQMYDVMKDIQSFFGRYSCFNGDVDAVAPGRSETFRERSEYSFGYDVEIILKIYTDLNLKKGWTYDSETFDRSDSSYELYEFNNGQYSIRWEPESVTKTSKRNTEDLYNEKLQELKNKMGVMTNSTLPAGTYYKRRRGKITEIEIEEKIYMLNKYINSNEFMPNPCSIKQAKYVAKFLGISEQEALNFNQWQAREMLNVYFDEDIDEWDVDYQEIKDFYLKKLGNH